MPNVIHVSKLGSQTALFYLTQGDAQTKAVTFVVPRNDGAENLDGLVWMLQIVNAAGQNDATGFLAEVKGSNLHMTWVCGGVLTAAAGRASIQLCGYDSTGAMQWSSGQYYIEVLERMSQTFSGEETEVMSELQILVDAAVRKAAEAAARAEVVACMTVKAHSIPAGYDATADFDRTTGVLTIGIPQAENGGAGGGKPEIGDSLDYDEKGRLVVNVTDKIAQNNNLPVSSSAVYTTVGNINALLETI